MSIFISFIKKEALHIVRDTRTMLITILMPLVLLMLFGFAISTEVNSVKVAATISGPLDIETQDILSRLDANSYIEFKGMTNYNEVEDLLRTGTIDAAVVLRRLNDGSLHKQVIVDASNTNVGQSCSLYVSSIIEGSNPGALVTIRTLYNPQLKSAYNFVPGIVGMIFILICAILTSVSIVSEKERGTMDLLVVSPIKSRTIIFGKLVPYFVLSCLILSIMLAMAYTVLGLPPSPNIASVILVSIIYIILSLAVGLFVSTMVSTQLAALIISAMGFMVPVLMLSGMIFPIENMPIALQWFSCIIPARWYIDAMRRLMIQQVPLSYVLNDLLILIGMAVLMLALAIKKFSSRPKSKKK